MLENMIGLKTERKFVLDVYVKEKTPMTLVSKKHCVNCEGHGKDD